MHIHGISMAVNAANCYSAMLEERSAVQRRMVLPHGFIKKTHKTPQAELDLARARQKEVEQ